MLGESDFSKMFGNLFYILGSVINIYIWVCIIRIFLSWSPALLMNPVGYFLCEACDPYLGFFRRFSFLQIGGIDLSPILSLGVLSLFKNICFSVYALGTFSLAGILFILLSTLWQVVSFLLNICILLSLLRFILDFSYKYRSSLFSTLIDSFFRSIRMFIIKNILGGRYEKERLALFLIFLFFILLKLLLYVIVILILVYALKIGSVWMWARWL